MAKAASDPFAAAVQEGERLASAGRLAEAEALSRGILARDGSHAGALHLLGIIAYRAHHYDESVRLIRRALAARRGDPAFHNNLGLALQAGGEFDEAVKSFRRAAAAHPDAATFHANLGNALKDAGDVDAALTSFRRALALEPQLAAGHFGRALCLLLLGRPRQAWPGYEWRVAHERGTPYIADPRGGGPTLPPPSQFADGGLQGKRLLVLQEQGLGDELFFLRSAPALRAAGAWLAYRGSARLAPLLRRSGAVDLLVEPDTPLPDTDHAVLVGDLPFLATQCEGAEFPPALPLTADPAALDRARELLRRAGPPPYLALTWRAGKTEQAGAQRTLAKSVPITDLARAVAGWRGTLLSVQRAPLLGELAGFERAGAPRPADLSATNDDLELMLALLELADDYAGVSNTNMHLRAGLARSARVLVPLPPEWRWTATGERSPWFPAFPLYRESRRAGWSAAIARLAADLA